MLEIHELVGFGDGRRRLFRLSSTQRTAGIGRARFPKPARRSPASSWSKSWDAGHSRGSSWRRERQLADRPVALKVTRRGSREPQTLARLQHTHIVPVHSHRIDAATGLHLLCMPYFGRITLARVLADPEVQSARSGRCRWPRPSTGSSRPAMLPAGSSAGRLEAVGARDSYPRAIAWWGAGWPRPSTTPTTGACSTAISSRPTCW